MLFDDFSSSYFYIYMTISEKLNIMVRYRLFPLYFVLFSYLELMGFYFSCNLVGNWSLVWCLKGSVIFRQKKHFIDQTRFVSIASAREKNFGMLVKDVIVQKSIYFLGSSFSSMCFVLRFTTSFEWYNAISCINFRNDESQIWKTGWTFK